ncbi:MAG: arginine--tRNA ligase [Candidatus Micrarchaeota archaeon]|nr:arginine--tRNA ligase [Candidatus Micrarchaeota archaeon]MDE1848211.1 arginine--tRNA ligase [Candidatus Micrarchaeota archaeon]MDE1864859.1 arginine--tRNA ligase [Candidatus Micrarchaeota archaeon]
MHPSPSANASDEFSGMLAAGIDAAFPGSAITKSDLSLSISVPKGEIGDLSSSICFKLSKTFKKSPREIAAQIAAKIRKGKLVLEISELNGYINAKLDPIHYSKLVLDSVVENGDDYGGSEIGSGQKVIVEFPSTNPNKAWHVGHLKNALLGDCVSNLLSFCSYEVEREDYIDDIGLQMAQSLWGWMHLSDKPDKKFDQWMGEQYVKVNTMLEKPGIKEEINAMLKRMEDSESKEARLIKEISEKCMIAQNQTAFSYGIYHDVMIKESEIVRVKLLEKALELADKKGILERPKEGKYANSTVVKLEKVAEFAKELSGNEEGAKVIVRSSGAATYAAKDFAFHMWKFGLLGTNFKYEKFLDQPNGKPVYVTSINGVEKKFGGVRVAINVIGSAQKYEQLVVKSMFYLLGHKEVADNLIHLSYGEVRLEGGVLSTRKGGAIGSARNYTADDLLREAKASALEIVSKSEKITDKGALDQIASAVALAAIKFEFLKVSPENNVVFSWEKALNFEGDSGPYCIYTYARATRVLEKGGYKPAVPSAGHLLQITRGSDFEVIKLIGSFPEIAQKACSEYRPNVVTDYVLRLSYAFSRFYESMPIIKGGEAMQVRLAITEATRQTIRNALRLVGIETLERM